MGCSNQKCSSSMLGERPSNQCCSRAIGSKIIEQTATRCPKLHHPTSCNKDSFPKKLRHGLICPACQQLRSRQRRTAAGPLPFTGLYSPQIQGENAGVKPPGEDVTQQHSPGCVFTCQRMKDLSCLKTRGLQHPKPPVTPLCITTPFANVICRHYESGVLVTAWGKSSTVLLFPQRRSGTRKH